MQPSFSAALSLERQLDDVLNFCTNPKEFSVFSTDPTFNIFNDNISLTVTTYRNIKLENPSTGPVSCSVDAPKERLKNLFSFCRLFVTENPEFSTLLAYGTDGKNEIANAFKRDVPFAAFLRCFIHYMKYM